jgi:PAS domain S-box-containing protein
MILRLLLRLRTFQMRLLLALALIGILPLAVTGVGVAILNRQTVAEQSARELTGLARGLAAELEVYLDNLLRQAQAMASLPAMTSMDPVRQGALLRELFHYFPAVARLSTFDLSGQRLASSRPGGVGSIASRTTFQSAIRRGVQMWEIGAALSTGRASFLICTPIRDVGRRVIGVLGTVVDFETLSSLLAVVPIGGGGRVFVLDGRGRVLLHPDGTAVQEHRDYAWLGVPTGGRLASPGTVRYASDGVPRIAGYAPVHSVGWTVVVERPEAEILAPARRAWILALVGLASSTSLALLSAILLARALTRPVRELASAAHALADGDSTAPLPALAPNAGELGTLVAAFAAMRTAVGQRELALRASEERFRNLIEGSIQGIIIHRMFQPLFVNQTYAHLFGYTPEEILAMDSILAIVPPPERSRLERYNEGRLRGEASPDHYAFQGVHKDGRIIWLEGQMKRVHWDGAPAVQSTVVDITAHKQAEAERERLQAQLRQAQKLEALGTLAGGIAHDFNNILGTILGCTELALDDVRAGSRPWSHLQEILASGQRAKEVVRQILTFSRKDAPQRQPVILQALVEDALRLMRASLPATIEICQSLEAPASTILADPTQMHQVLLNLCSNAEHAMRDNGGVLTVRLEALTVTADVTMAHPPLQSGPHLRLTVQDSGHGIAPEVLERIFDPFFTTKGVGEGTGLGLAVVHGIITDHGGAIAVASAPGGGTLFTLYIPAIDAAMPEVRAPEPLSRGCERILCVDDERALLYAVQDMLASLGYEVTVYASSLEALTAFRQSPEDFDLLIVDQTMPRLTGEALAQAVRCVRPEIPVILCTGFSHTMTSEKAAALGLQGYLAKPFSSRELSAAVRQALDSRHR